MNPLTAEIATAQNSDNKLILIIGVLGVVNQNLFMTIAMKPVFQF